MNKIAFFLNYPSHYRENIFLKIEKELNVDYYFGSIDEGEISKIDFTRFNNIKAYNKTRVFFKKIKWVEGIAFTIPFKKYDKYVLTGDPYCLTTWCILIINSFLRKQTFLWTHGWYGHEGFVKKIVKKVFFKLSSGCFLYGNYAKELMIENGIPERKLHVIYNSLDYENQLKFRSMVKYSNVYEEYFKNKNPVIIFIGRLTEVKKLDILIESQSKLHKTGRPFNILFLGEGSEKLRLIEQVTKKGLTNSCWFFGSCYDENLISNFIYNANLCVSPGNVGLTAIHVLMYGIPIITHNNFSKQMPEFESIEEGKTGLFFIEDDALDLMEKIEEALLKIENKLFNKDQCFKKIDLFYNSNYQIKILKNTLL